MKKIIIASFLLISHLIISSLSYLYTFKIYVENNYKNINIKFEKGVFLINGESFSIIELPVSQLSILISNVVFLALAFLYFKNNKTLTNIFKKTNFKKLLIVTLIIIPIIIIEGFIEKFDFFQNDTNFQIVFSESLRNNVLIIINITLLMPFIEELIFRQHLLSGLKELLKNKHLAVFISSLPFALLHFQYNFPILIILYLFSLVLGYSFVQNKNNIIFPFAIHAINNFLSILLASYF